MTTKQINDILSLFTSYIVDAGSDPGFLPVIKAGIVQQIKSNDDVDIDEVIFHIEHLVGEIASMQAETKDYLNVYTSDPMEPYSGGVALIAAHDSDEACELRDTLCEWNNYDEPKLVNNLRYIGEPEVIFDATYRE